MKIFSRLTRLVVLDTDVSSTSARKAMTRGTEMPLRLPMLLQTPSTLLGLHMAMTTTLLRRCWRSCGEIKFEVNEVVMVVDKFASEGWLNRYENPTLRPLFSPRPQRLHSATGARCPLSFPSQIPAFPHIFRERRLQPLELRLHQSNSSALPPPPADRPPRS